MKRSKIYSTDIGYGVCVREHNADLIKSDLRPSGYVVEIHFYKKEDAVFCASDFIRDQVERAKNEDPIALEKTIGLLGGV